MDAPDTQPAPAEPAAIRKLPPKNESLLPEGVKTGILLILVLAVAYVLYDSYQFQQKVRSDLDKITELINTVEDATKSGQAHLNNLKGVWTYVADVFAVALVFLAITGMTMMKGSRGLAGRGKWFVLAGLAIPVGFVVYMYW